CSNRIKCSSFFNLSTIRFIVTARPAEFLSNLLIVCHLSITLDPLCRYFNKLFLDIRGYPNFTNISYLISTSTVFKLKVYSKVLQVSVFKRYLYVYSPRRKWYD